MSLVECLLLVLSASWIDHSALEHYEVVATVVDDEDEGMGECDLHRHVETT